MKDMQFAPRLRQVMANVGPLVFMALSQAVDTSVGGLVRYLQPSRAQTKNKNLS